MNNFSIFHNIPHGFFSKPFNALTDYHTLTSCLPFHAITYLDQVHGNTAVIIDQNNYHQTYQADALITSVSGIGLLIKVADCQAIQVYDPVHKQVANIHAGWRGVVKGIISATLQKMSGDPRDFLVGITPSLGPCCAQFSNPQKELPAEFHRYIGAERKVDFWRAVEDQLQADGVLPKNIERIRVCTKCYQEKDQFPYYSHRRQDEGRMGSVVGVSCRYYWDRKFF